ncbi:MAG: ribosome hibernation-promoting factor, HPF/YfiA family [Planctomycetota bacterium]
MNIAITGRHVGVTESMKAYAREKIEKLRKYFERATAARATMDIVHDSHEVEIVFEVTRGVRLVGKAEAPDMYAACDLAEQKLAGQLRRFKQRLTDHHRGERRTEVDVPPQAGEGAESVGDEAPTTYEDVIERMRKGE